jgi:farnesyl diphosphate synthase
MSAINDASLLRSTIFVILKAFFAEKDYYVHLIELFNETSLQAEVVRMLGRITAEEAKVDMHDFQMRKHCLIARYKSALYALYLPVALAMFLAGVATPSRLKQVKDLVFALAELDRIHSDYLDCYGGTSGTAIQGNKCSWLVLKALEICTPEQRQLLKANYGRKDVGAEETVKTVYRQLDLEGHYKIYEKRMLTEMLALMLNIQQSLNREFLFAVQEKWLDYLREYGSVKTELAVVFS